MIMSVLIGFIAGLVTGIALVLGTFFCIAAATLKKERDKNEDKNKDKDKEAK